MISIVTLGDQLLSLPAKSCNSEKSVSKQLTVLLSLSRLKPEQVDVD